MRTALLLLLLTGTTRAQSITPCFTPGQDCASVVAHEIDGATSTVLVQAYGFTSRPIEQALIAAHKRGVDVQIILDRSNRAQKWSGLRLVEAAEIPTAIDAAHAIAHNKVMVIDNTVTMTGSFNFTTSAQAKNAENLLIIRDAELAQKYTQNFLVHKAHAVKP